VFKATITMPIEYDMTGKKVVFSIGEAGRELFVYSSGTDTQLEISGQVITVAIAPTTNSENSLATTLNSLLSDSSKDYGYSISIGVDGNSYFDHRLQGLIRPREEHGDVTNTGC